MSSATARQVRQTCVSRIQCSGCWSDFKLEEVAGIESKEERAAQPIMCTMLTLGMRPVAVKLLRLVFKSVSAPVHTSMERRIVMQARATEARPSRRSVGSNREVL